MFSGCTKFNKQIIFTGSPNFEKTMDIAGMFKDCTKFNQPMNFYNFPAGDAFDVFEECSLLNSLVTLPAENSLITDKFSAASMFYNCINFNQNIYFPSYYNDFGYCFRNCTKFGKNIYINSTLDNSNVDGMLMEMNNSLRKNLWFRPGFLNQEKVAYIAGAFETITWSTAANRIYNTAYNIYIYNNYNP